MKSTPKIQPVKFAEVKRVWQQLNWLIAHPYAPNPYNVDTLVSDTERWVRGFASRPPTSSMREELLRHLAKTSILHCRRCGCTEDYACIGGCDWAKPGICTECV